MTARMTARGLIADAAARLARSDTAWLDASLLLAARLGISREALLAKLPDGIVAPPGFEEDVARRAAGESLAYILGYREFFGRRFAVDQRVLVPRPDTEILVEAALESGDSIARERGAGAPPRIHDACTGSGAVALSVAAERPSWLVSASDISAPALDVARANSAAILGREIPMFRSDLLEAVEGAFDIITANPPYVPGAETCELLAQGWGEPRLALDGGEDGLDLIRRLVPQAFLRLSPGGILLIEADGSQAGDIRAILSSAGFVALESRRDLAGIERVSGGLKPWMTG